MCVVTATALLVVPVAAQSTEEIIHEQSYLVTVDMEPVWIPVQRAQGSVGWEIQLEIDDPDAVDVDLFVFDGEPSSLGSRRLCSSAGVSNHERCRLVSMEYDEIWIELDGVGGSGETNTQLSVYAIRGVLLPGTNLVVDEAVPLFLPDQAEGFLSPDFGPYDDTELAFFVDERASSPLRVTIRTEYSDEYVRLRAFNADLEFIDEVESRNGYGELELDVPGKIYLVVSGGDSYADFVLATEDPSVPTLLPIGDSLVVRRGRGNRTFLLDRLTAGVFVVRLNGRGEGLTVEMGGREQVTHELLPGRQHVAPIGRSVFGRLPLLGEVAADFPATVTVTAGTSPYGGSNEWSLELIPSGAYAPYVIDMALLTPTPVADDGSLPLEIRGEVDAEDIVLYEMPAQLRSDAGSYWGMLSAQLVDPLDGSVHLAVADALGRVIDIDPRAVRWDAADVSGPVYLALFADPANPGNRRRFTLEVRDLAR